MTPGLFGDHWVSGSLEVAMRMPLHMLVVLLCSAYRVFSCSLPFLSSPPFPPFFIVLVIIYPVGSPLLLQFSVSGAGAGFFWWAGLVDGLQVGQALRCSSYLGLESAVPAPMFLGTQPPYATKGVNRSYQSQLSSSKRKA